MTKLQTVQFPAIFDTGHQETTFPMFYRLRSLSGLRAIGPAGKGYRTRGIKA